MFCRYVGCADIAAWELRGTLPQMHGHREFQAQPVEGSNPEKKAASFRTFSKSGLDPPPLVLDTFEVTFI